MQTSRKIHRKIAIAELIAKVGEKLNEKGTKIIGGDRYFFVGKYSAVFHWISMKIIMQCWNCKHGRSSGKTRKLKFKKNRMVKFV
jgi:hypothetical protein